MRIKIFAAVLVIIVITVLIVGCVGSPGRNYELPQGLLEARIAENTVTPTSLTLILSNNTERRYYYGNPFRIEKLVGNEWVEPEFVGFVLWTYPAFNLDSGDEVEIEKNWEMIYGALEPGTYRIVKGYFYWRGDGAYWGAPADIDEYEIRVEFVIERAAVEMRVKENTLTPTGLTLIVTNNADRRYTSGLGFHIERRVDGEWIEPDLLNELIFFSIGVPFPPNNSVELERNWDWFYGALEPGTYRIIKSYAYLREQGDFDEYEVYAEFVIEM